MIAAPPHPLALWGGVECTVNRVGDVYRDQIAWSGHDRRPSDLDLFAGLGIAALRTPILWERTHPDPHGEPDWRWPDAQLSRLRRLGIRPIVGLLHHGSGPPHTHLLDAHFPTLFARYAGAVARRYPWVDDWTPVNEPVTTARFAALYGHWYPHRRDERSFWVAVLNQIDATRMAMTAIRAINPRARLIQTDDLGRTDATPPLADQAAFDNMRRWAGWDLLFGRVTASHPMSAILDRLGLGDRARAIVDDPCPPDIVGVNHYLTSDRFLDHRIDRYPAHLHGGNDRLAYADTEAVRVLDPPIDGLGRALREAWQRYRAPIAVTEVHNGCTLEEQMRWAADAWDAAAAVRDEGADVRAVTAWALLGTRGWNTLLTADGLYEAGVFDMATGSPRPTALAALWRGLPLGAPRHPVAAEQGWWHRPDRLRYPPQPSGTAPRTVPRPTPAPLLISTGCATRSGDLVHACRARGLGHVVVERSCWQTPAGAATLVERERPWAVVVFTDGDRDGGMRAPASVDDAADIAPWAAAASEGSVPWAVVTCETVTFGPGRRSDTVWNPQARADRRDPPAERTCRRRDDTLSGAGWADLVLDGLIEASGTPGLRELAERIPRVLEPKPLIVLDNR